MIRRSEQGFTLVEIVTTVLVVSIMVGSVISIFMGIQSVQNRTARLDIATRAAQREVESLRNNNYNSLTPGQNINFSGDLPASLPGTKTGTAAVTEPITGLRRVDVTVTYTDGGVQRQVELSSLIGDIGITQ